MKYAFLLSITLTLLALDAHAKYYKWVDEKGNVHYTTTPPPESGVHDRVIIGDQGQEKGVIRGKITEEEKVEMERLAAEEAARKKAESDSKKHDRILLISYKTVDDILVKRDLKLAYLDDLIKTREMDRIDAKEEYDQLLEEAILVERQGKAPSEEMKANLRSAQREFKASNGELAKARADREKIMSATEADIKRFKELKGIK